MGPKWPICNFLVETIIITFIYLLALFIVQNLKKFLQQIQSYKDAPFLGQQWPFVMNKFFLVQTIIITFIYLLALFIVQNLKNNSYSESRVMRMCHFWAQNGSFTPKICSEKEILISLSSTYWLLSFCKILKKFLEPIQSYEDVPFLGPKWSICPKQIFFWKIINITLIYLLAPFIVQNFKKILPADPQL